jgi:hypothetical protein
MFKTSPVKKWRDFFLQFNYPLMNSFVDNL